MRKTVVSEGTIKAWIESPGRLREKNNAGKENHMNNLSKDTEDQTTAHTKETTHHP